MSPSVPTTAASSAGRIGAARRSDSTAIRTPTVVGAARPVAATRSASVDGRVGPARARSSDRPDVERYAAAEADRHDQADEDDRADREHGPVGMETDIGIGAPGHAQWEERREGDRAPTTARTPPPTAASTVGTIPIITSCRRVHPSSRRRSRSSRINCSSRAVTMATAITPATAATAAQIHSADAKRSIAARAPCVPTARLCAMNSESPRIARDAASTWGTSATP